MNKKQIFLGIILSLQTVTTIFAVDDKFVSTTGNTCIESLTKDVCIEASGDILIKSKNGSVVIDPVTGGGGPSIACLESGTGVDCSYTGAALTDRITTLESTTGLDSGAAVISGTQTDIIAKTGNLKLESVDKDVNIFADIDGSSTGKMMIQSGTNSALSTVAGDIGMAALNSIILKAATKDIFIEAGEYIKIGEDYIYTSPLSISSDTRYEGDLIVNNDLTINSNSLLDVRGNLIVRGSVNIAANSTLTVSGDIIFDGGNEPAAGGLPSFAPDHKVIINGDITYRWAPSKPGAKNVIIKNYVYKSFANSNEATIQISGNIVAVKDIIICDNLVGSSDLGIAGSAVDIKSSSIINSLTGDIILSRNQGSFTAAIRIMDSAKLEGNRVLFVSNYTLYSSLDSHGVSIASGTSVIGRSEIRLERNKGMDYLANPVQGAVVNAPMKTTQLYIHKDTSASFDIKNIKFESGYSLTAYYNDTAAGGPETLSLDAPFTL